MFHQHAAILAADAPNAWGVGLLIVAGLLVLAYFAFVIAAFVSILRSDLDGGMKLVWLVFAFCAPFLGSLCWFCIGRKNVVAHSG